MFVACSGGADPVEDDASDFNGPGGGAAPDVTALCEQQCAPTYPSGEADYRATRSCLLCDACYVACKAEGVDLSVCPGDPATDGCSATDMTCTACVTGACALAEIPGSGTHTGVCAAFGDTCSNNVECVGMTNCVNACVTNTPPQM